MLADALVDIASVRAFIPAKCLIPVFFLILTDGIDGTGCVDGVDGIGGIDDVNDIGGVGGTSQEVELAGKNGWN
jgi:hypothetical protein